MPIIKSAKKRVRVAEKATVRNRKTKRTLKSTLKSFSTALSGNKTKANDAQAKAYSAIDTAVKKGVMHKNKAARKKAQIARQAKAAGVKVSAKKTAARAPVSKATAKKAPAKKTTKK